MFTVLTDSRSGSHLLQTLLDSHPQLRCYGEILGLDRRKKNFYRLGAGQGCLVDYPNLLVGNRWAFDNDIPRILKIIKANPVIHLTRDLEQRAKSQLFYHKAKHVHKGVRAVIRRQVHLPSSLDRYDVKSVRQVVRGFTDRQRNCLQLFSEQERSRWLEVTYEWLCGDQHIRKLPLAKAAVLCQHLGVKPQALRTDLYKLRDFGDTKKK